MLHEPKSGHEFDESGPNDEMPGRDSGRLVIVDEELSYKIVGAFYEVFNELGFGYSEAIYQRALQIVLTQRGLLVEREVPIDVYFRGELIGRHRLDFRVEGRIVLEVKATERLPPHTMKQVRNYLTASRLNLGLVLHFGPRAAYHRILAPGAIQRPRSIRPDSSHSSPSAAGATPSKDPCHDAQLNAECPTHAHD